MYSVLSEAVHLNDMRQRMIQKDSSTLLREERILCFCVHYVHLTGKSSSYRMWLKRTESQMEDNTEGSKTASRMF